MFRIFVDPYGDGTYDLFYRAEYFAKRKIVIADSGAFVEFLKISRQEVMALEEVNRARFVAKKLIQCWKLRIESLSMNQEIFLPFEISEQYIAGQLIKKFKKGYYLQEVWSEEIDMYGVDKSTLDMKINELKDGWRTEDADLQAFNSNAVFRSLETSLQQLNY